MYNYYNPNPAQPVGSQQPMRYQIPMQQITGLKGRPVASIDEARAATIDFDGSIFFFPDLANKKIYTKQINMDGTMSLNIYDMQGVPPKEEVIYVTREEFENTINQIKQVLAAGAQPITEPSPQTGAPATANKQFEVKF